MKPYTMINDTELFDKLKATSADDTISVWEVFADYCIENDLPKMHGLDHIDETSNQFVFSDRGCNGVDHSYKVRRG